MVEERQYFLDNDDDGGRDDDNTNLTYIINWKMNYIMVKPAIIGLK